MTIFPRSRRTWIIEVSSTMMIAVARMNIRLHVELFSITISIPWQRIRICVQDIKGIVVVSNDTILKVYKWVCFLLLCLTHYFLLGIHSELWFSQQRETECVLVMRNCIFFMCVDIIMCPVCMSRYVPAVNVVCDGYLWAGQLSPQGRSSSSQHILGTTDDLDVPGSMCFSELLTK